MKDLPQEIWSKIFFEYSGITHETSILIKNIYNNLIIIDDYFYTNYFLKLKREKINNEILFINKKY